MQKVTFKGKDYDVRHGGPFDRGAADSYYGRPQRPHYFTGSSYQSQEILLEPGTPAYDDYMAGYEFNELQGDKKYWP